MSTAVGGKKIVPSTKNFGVSGLLIVQKLSVFKTIIGLFEQLIIAIIGN